MRITPTARTRIFTRRRTLCPPRSYTRISNNAVPFPSHSDWVRADVVGPAWKPECLVCLGNNEKILWFWRMSTLWLIGGVVCVTSRLRKTSQVDKSPTFPSWIRKDQPLSFPEQPIDDNRPRRSRSRSHLWLRYNGVCRRRVGGAAGLPAMPLGLAKNSSRNRNMFSP